MAEGHSFYILVFRLSLEFLLRWLLPPRTEAGNNSHARTSNKFFGSKILLDRVSTKKAFLPLRKYLCSSLNSKQKHNNVSKGNRSIQ